jgi:hypothetical protein
MPVITGRTRLQLETAIGYNLQAIFAGSWTSNTSTTVNTDTKWKGDVDGANGKWLHATSGGETGEIVRVTDDSGAGALTHDALTGTPSSGETYILWDERYRPDAIYDFINQAIMSLNGRAYNPDESIALHADGAQTRFDIPTGFSMINGLYYRSGFSGKTVHACDRLFDEVTDADFTQTNPSEDKKTGSSSLRIAIANGAAAGDFVSDSISSLDLTDMTHIEMWIKSSTLLSANDFRILLDNGKVLNNGTDQERLNVPAVGSFDTWTYVRMPLANPQNDGAIVSVGIDYAVDVGIFTVWFDDIKAVHNDEAIWTSVPRRLWHIDKNARDLVLTSAGRSLIGYALLKIVGGDEPLLLTADANTNEVSDEYVIAKATSLAFESLGPDDNKTARAISRWNRATDRAYRKLPLLTNVREVE